MNLKQLLEGISYEVQQGTADVEISDFQYDSRKVEKDGLFVCITGFQTDGHKYIPMALEKGAAALLCEHRVENVPEGVTVLVTENNRIALALLSDHFYGHPSAEMNVIGVTGTNGKTSTTYLMKSILDRIGKKVGIIGTIENRIGDEVLKAERTTPESKELQALFRRMKNEDVTDVVMEVSSHSLDLHRVDGIAFDVAIFTNLTQDHLDFHKTMERYALAKQELFRMLKPSGKAIINYDDSYKHYFLLEENENVTFGFTGGDFKVALDAADKEHTEFSVQCPAFTQNFSTNLIGTYNIYNLMASVVILTLEQFDSATIAQAAAALTLPKGRTECIHTGNNLIMVDYAHTPDAMSKVLTAARALTSGSIYVVFGCTGERDRDKRAKMSAIACKHADYVIMTHDDPHYEDQAQIYHDMTSGLSYDNYEIVHDRKDAIRKGISLLDTDDILLILGKGHEEFIVCRDKRIPFNDMNVARQCLSERRTPTAARICQSA